MLTHQGSRSVHGCLAALLLTGVALAQLPPHPRLMFTPAEKAAIVARIAVPGSPAAQAFASLATSSSLARASSMPSLSVQASWDVANSMRQMTEVAFRYQMTGNSAFASNARATLLTACAKLLPHQDDPWRMGSYVIAMALTYDLIHETLSATDRTTVVNHLEAWMSVWRTGRTPVTTFANYTGAADNYAFGAFAGTVAALLATAESSSRPDPIGEAMSYLEKLRAGWNDTFSPDGSYDEGYGYATYGGIYSLWSAWAAERVGLGDWVSGTNVVRAPWFFGSTLTGSGYFWFADSSSSHRGTNIDPAIWMVIGRDGGALGTPPAAETVWALNRVFALSPPSTSTSSHGLSPHLPVILWYPQHVTPRAPQIVSGFFRDNRNDGTVTTIKHRTTPDMGRGGIGILHSEVRLDARAISAFYSIRDEWMNHGHEDDGHVSLAVGGVPMFIDLGASRSDFIGAQSDVHNIVLSDGQTGFAGVRNNYYTPPVVTLDGVTRTGSFGGQKESCFIGLGADYLRGSHRGMWQFQDASRSVFLVKGAELPYIVVQTDVQRDGSQRTYRERWHAAASTTGSGTVQSPLITSSGGQTMRSVWLSPASATVQRQNGTAVATIPGFPVDIVASGQRVSFLSVHSSFAIQSQAPLVMAAPGTVGARLTIPGYVDKIMADTTRAGVEDAESASDARFVWLRLTASSVQSLFAADASILAHGGRQIFASTRPVSISVRPGLVEVSSQEGSAGQPLRFTVNLPGIVEVRVDGTSVPFSRNADGIAVGGELAPVFHNDDRGYCFTEGFLWDARPDANAYIDPQGFLTSSAGWGTLRLFGDRAFGARPVSFGFEALANPTATGEIAGLHFGSVIGGGDLLRVVIDADGPANLRVRAFRPGVTYGSWPLALRSAEGGAGIQVGLYPASQEAVISDALGTEVARFSMPAMPSQWYAKVMVTPMARIDEVTVFDSAEDGATPQGVAFYGLPSGKAAFFLRTPGLVQMRDLKPAFDGYVVEPALAQAWWLGAQIAEMQVTPYIYAAPAPIQRLDSAGFGSAVTALHTFRGAKAGIILVKPDGTQLYGEYTY